MNSMNIIKGDTVVVLSGREKGKKGKVIASNPSKMTVIVEGVNLATCHKKPRKQGEEGGILKQEAAIRVCKVMRVCPKCGKPTRCAHKILDNGDKVRVCKKCNQNI